MNKYTLKEIKSKNVLSDLIEGKESFQIVALSGKMLDTVKLVETAIEKVNLSCRVYTSGRITSVLAFPLSLYNALAIAAHNIATYNPDYEIEKHLIDNMLTVTYKK